MIQYAFLLILLSASKAISCHKMQTAPVPSCIQSRIDSLTSAAKTNPASKVQQFSYHGKTVYLFSAGCCDQFNTVYDDSCHYVCAPSGGLTGKGDSKCPDFTANAKLIKVIWKDSR